MELTLLQRTYHKTGEVTYTYSMHRRQLVLFGFIIESFEGLGVVTTEQRGWYPRVRVDTTADCAEDFEQLIEQLKLMI